MCIRDRKEIGGKDSPIILISKEEGRSTLDLFLKYFALEGKEVGEGKKKVMVHRKIPPKPAKDAKPPTAEPFSTVKAQLIGPNKEAIAALMTKPSAIAYVSVGTGQEMAAKTKGRIKLLDLDGVKATVANVASGKYPLRRPLNVMTKGKPTGLAKDFIDFLTGPEGQKIVSSQGFIPISQ